jgi:hypothetical protein
MQEAARQARNTQRLAELHPAFATRISAVIASLEDAGYRPRIQDGWRSPQSQLEAFNSGKSKLKFGYHNVTGAGGKPESLAVDLLDDDFPLNSRLDYLLHLAASASAVTCQTGIRWGLPAALCAAIDSALAARDWSAKLKIGWDPTHVEPTDVTVTEARNGKRPAELSSRGMRHPKAKRRARGR